MSKRLHEDDDDDDDYMSDKILAAAQALAPQLLNPRRRVPPPPIPTEKPRHLIEIEQREQGLSTAITSDNKGFQLLKKMGYKEGSKLGTNQTHGLIEPIPIKIHPSRSGLGEQNEKKEKFRIKEEIKTKFNQQIQSNYQDNLKQKYYLKRLRIDIRKCQSICERLDREKFHLEENILWKNNKQDIDEDNDEEDKSDQSNMESLLKNLTEYLREKHLYCIWCGQTFETLEELEDTCPGNQRDLH
jgi:acyl transferase domain-containing protein